MSDQSDERARARLRELLDSGREVDIREIVLAVLGLDLDDELVELVLSAVQSLEVPISNDHLIRGINNLRLWREDNS